jgi:hypothetical protein
MDTQKIKKAEIQDIFAAGEVAYKQKYPMCKQQRKALHSIIHCRGPQMGRHIDKCDHCGHCEISYNSCRNRHCPKCQGSKQYEWAEHLKGSLPPVRYFHLVFTLPHELNELVYKYQKVCYNTLFSASSQTVMQVTARPEFLGAQTGCLSVLHTWGQNLQYHPHIHMLVPAGGLSEDLMEWIPTSKKFFVPVKVLSRVFRGKFVHLMEELVQKGEISFSHDFKELKSQLYRKDWVVYSKKTFAGPAQVLQYLGRYTHRVAISNHRIIDHEQGKVTFRWKDYRNGNQWKTMQLDSLEFIRRYLLHVLPCNFYKIRYYGLFAIVNRGTKMNLCFRLIARTTGYVINLCKTSAEGTLAIRTGYKRVCPACNKGILQFSMLLSVKNNVYT